MRSIVYTSTQTRPITDTELAQILAVGREKNTALPDSVSSSLMAGRSTKPQGSRAPGGCWSGSGSIPWRR
ncbi:hypothetical protein FHW23_000116 [Curtobacterium pusillum]|uniref:Uncharacterized protein n=1 Tax=Curtobacterium pusillum TaxID=69373 RepID=A0AAW3T136_9MICO|nr:hypothetical protein [Curtobacterium pusillum]